jgi:hypothetical protein
LRYRIAVPNLREVLEHNRLAIEAGLREAQAELVALDDRKRELETLIARARASLGEIEPRNTPKQRLKLHEAMELVLSESPNRSMSVQDLARTINERALYEKRDQSAVEPNQIHARASSKSYSHLFAKRDGVVTLLAAR